MQSTPVDFDAEQLLQPDITEMNVPSEVIQQGELAWFVRRFEDDGVEPERTDKPFRVCGIQVSILIEQSDSLCAFPGFDDELDRTGIEPFLALVDPRRERPIAEPTVVFLSELHLNVEAAALRGADNVTRMELALGETLPAFDSSHADIGAQVEVCRKFSLRDSNFKWSSACDGRDAIRAGHRNLHPGRAFIRNHPAGH